MTSPGEVCLRCGLTREEAATGPRRRMVRCVRDGKYYDTHRWQERMDREPILARCVVDGCEERLALQFAWDGDPRFPTPRLVIVCPAHWQSMEPETPGRWRILVEDQS